MAYCRFGSDSDFYIFWDSSESGTTKDEQAIAVWHMDHTKTGFSLTYTECVEATLNSDYTSIPGYKPKYKNLIESTLLEFISDVDAEDNY